MGDGHDPQGGPKSGRARNPGSTGPYFSASANTVLAPREVTPSALEGPQPPSKADEMSPETTTMSLLSALECHMSTWESRLSAA